MRGSPCPPAVPPATAARATFGAATRPGRLWSRAAASVIAASHAIAVGSFPVIISKKTAAAPNPAAYGTIVPRPTVILGQAAIAASPRRSSASPGPCVSPGARSGPERGERERADREPDGAGQHPSEIPELDVAQRESRHHIVSVPIARVPHQKQRVWVHPLLGQESEHSALTFPVLVLLEDLRRKCPFKPGRTLVGEHLEGVAVVKLEPAASRVAPEEISSSQLTRVESRPNPGKDHTGVALRHEHQKEKEEVRENDCQECPSERAPRELRRPSSQHASSRLPLRFGRQGKRSRRRPRTDIIPRGRSTTRHGRRSDGAHSDQDLIVRVVVIELFRPKDGPCPVGETPG